MTENVSLSWALVHSKQPHDVQRGIAMLEVIEGIKIYSLYSGSFILHKNLIFYVPKVIVNINNSLLTL